MVSRLRAWDICALINKGYRSSLFQDIRKHAKETVLFHCLDQQEDVGGGKIDSRHLRSLGIRRIFYPLHEAYFAWNVEAFHRGNRALLKLHRLSPGAYAELKQSIEGFTPTTGFAAIWTILSAPQSCLYVSGMTFFRTSYKQEYATASGLAQQGHCAGREIRQPQSRP